MQSFRNNMTFYNPENLSCQRPDPLSSMPLAMAYVPWQRWENILDADKGFHCGTILHDLRKPFEHGGGGCR